MEEINVRSAVLTGIGIALVAFMLFGCSKPNCGQQTDAQSCLQNKCNWDATLSVCTAPQ